jgi:hypothetical protein
MAYTPIHNYRGKDALASGDSAKIVRGSELSEEFEAIRDDLATSAVTVSVKYNGDDVMYSNNVERVDQTGNQTFVYFGNQVEEFDNHYAVQITPFVYLGNGGGQPAICSLTGFTENYVSFTTKILDGNNWVDPNLEVNGIGFSLIIIDIKQN